jgi:hypothetical protein
VAAAPPGDGDVGAVCEGAGDGVGDPAAGVGSPEGEWLGLATATGGDGEPQDVMTRRLTNATAAERTIFLIRLS